MEWFVLALATAFFAAVAAIIEKNVLKKEHSLEFSTNFSFINVLLCLPIFFIIDLTMRPLIIFLIYLGTLLSTFAFYFIIKSLRYLDISVVSPLMNLESLFVALLAFFILAEHLTFQNYFGIGLLFLGTYVLECDQGIRHLKRPLQRLLSSKYMLLIIIATAFYGASSIIAKHVLTTINPLPLLLIAHVFVLFNFTIFSSFKEHRINPVHHLKNFGFYGLLASVFTVAYRLTQVLAMSIAFVSLVIPIKKLSTLFATFIGGELFHEKAVLQRSVACLILIIGASLLIL